MAAYNKWSEEEIETIKTNAGNLTDEQLQQVLNEIFSSNRRLDAIRKMRQRLGIKKKAGRGVCQIEKL